MMMTSLSLLLRKDAPLTYKVYYGLLINLVSYCVDYVYTKIFHQSFGILNHLNVDIMIVSPLLTSMCLVFYFYNMI